MKIKINGIYRKLKKVLEIQVLLLYNRRCQLEMSW